MDQDLFIFRSVFIYPCSYLLLAELQQGFQSPRQVGSNKDLYKCKAWHPTPVLLPRKSHGRRSLVGCSPWGRQELDTTEQLHFHFSLSCIGEGNGNPLQCSCLENRRDGRAWWAAVYGVTQNLTRLKQLSSSSSSINNNNKKIYLIQIHIHGKI